MSDNEKAAHILAYMARVHRPAVRLEVEDILEKCSGTRLDYYYRWLCLPLN